MIEPAIMGMILKRPVQQPKEKETTIKRFFFYGFLPFLRLSKMDFH
jgi:hypothetical protein